jgi:hypothetical protein
MAKVWNLHPGSEYVSTCVTHGHNSEYIRIPAYYHHTYPYLDIQHRLHSNQDAFDEKDDEDGTDHQENASNTSIRYYFDAFSFFPLSILADL